MAELLGLTPTILAAAISSGTAILLAAIGEIFAERSGIMNLGVEGMMLTGALSGFAASWATGSPWLGFLCGALAGCLLSLLHAFLAITLRANQVVSGLSLMIFGTGVSGFYGLPMVGRPAVGFSPLPLPFLSDLPFLGAVLFRQDPLVYLSFLLVPTAWLFASRTRSSLDLRAVGENPHAADAMGLKVARIRYLYVLIGGSLAGGGGAYLSLAQTRMWVQNMTAGQGWIALALVIFSLWNPLRAAAGAYLFGGITAVQLRLQAVGTVIPIHFLLMQPYILTVVVLVILSVRGRARGATHAPASLGLPFDREDRSRL